MNVNDLLSVIPFCYANADHLKHGEKFMVAKILAIALAASQSAPMQTDIGAELTVEQFIALAEPALVSMPPKAKEVTFKWPYKLVAGPAGYYTCGVVAVHRGRVPREEIWVSAVVANGKVVNSQWSTYNGMLAWDCKRNVRSGSLKAR
jgi:hypothetical protein